MSLEDLLTKMTNNELPEAPVSINTNVKSKGGYEYQLTLRGTSYIALLENLEEMEKNFAKFGLTPMPKYAPRAVFGQKREIEYVKVDGADMVCPMCKVGHVKIIKSAKGTFYGCDNSKFNPATKSYEGCKFFTKDDPSKPTEDESINF